jgi:hypothetical protein
MSDEQKPANAADPGAVKDKAKKDRLRERQRKEDWRKVLDLQEGRNVMRQIVNEFCGVDNQFQSLAEESMQYSEGRRVVGLKIRKLIKREFPNHWLVMNKEEIDQEIVANG